MSNVVDFDSFKKTSQQQALLETVRNLAELPIEWRLRRKAIDFMNEFELSAPDLLCILATATGISDFAGAGSFTVSGFSSEGTAFSLAVVLSADPVCLKILKGWKGAEDVQQSA